MSGGENSAKQALYAEAESMARDLTNGHAADPEKQGHALAFLIRAIKPLFLETFVTESGLETRLRLYRDDCPVHQDYRRKRNTSFKLGPVSWQGHLSQLGMAALLFIYLVGKGKGWW